MPGLADAKRVLDDSCFYAAASAAANELAAMARSRCCHDCVLEFPAGLIAETEPVG